MNDIALSIDRIVLSDMDVTAERSEAIRDVLEGELKWLLKREGLKDRLTGNGSSYLSVVAMHMNEALSDAELASSLARVIVQALQNIR